MTAESPHLDLVSALGEQVQRHQRHVLAAVEDLDDEQLDAVVVGSGWSPRRMLTHLLFDVEIFWMGAVLGGDPRAVSQIRDGWSARWLPGDELRARYRKAAAKGLRHLATVDLSSPPVWWPPPDVFDAPRLTSNLAVVLRVVDELATHAGHLDIVREHLDGRQFLVVG